MDKNQSYDDLFSLIVSVLHNKQSKSIEDCGRIVTIAEHQAVVGLVCDAKSFVSSALTQEMRTKCVGQVVALERQNCWMDKQVARLASTFDKHGVRYAVMKGQTCAAFYPIPSHRVPGDIDVYVVPDDFERCCNLLTSMGFTLTDKTMLHYSYKSGKLYVELHFAIQKMQFLPYFRRLKNITKQAFDDTTTDSVVNIGGYRVRILPPELNMLLLTVHSFSHIISGGLGLRQIIDWQVMLQTLDRTIRWNIMSAWLKDLHLKRMFLVLGYINVAYLGMDKDIFLHHGLDVYAFSTRRMGERLLSWTKTCGNFGLSMDLGHGRMRFARYYLLFGKNLVRFFWLNPMEMLAWPLMKAYRGAMSKNHLKQSTCNF